ncbi:MAG: hypothetical protein N2V75_11850 [Methanophagales archaeon]|nr:hypothetical protein [Methanophagales archaeon]
MTEWVSECNCPLCLNRCFKVAIRLRVVHVSADIGRRIDRTPEIDDVGSMMMTFENEVLYGIYNKEIFVND